MAISEDTRALVAQRAGRACEYCKAPNHITGYRFHVEHIVPRHHAGTDDLSNLAFSCVTCNAHKSTHLASKDPTSGAIVALYHPRKDSWDEHFALERQTGEIRGLSPTGRATAKRLSFNRGYRVEARLAWLEAGWL